MNSFRVEQVLKKLGNDLKDARRRRRITTKLMAERIGITRVTLSKIEAGDPKVSMGSYALAIYILGKIEILESLMDRANDSLGLDIMEESLPKRIRKGKKS